MLEFNIAPNTQIGRIEIDHQVYDNENAYNIEEGKYSRGGEFLDNFVTDNIIEFSKRWLHLAGFKEMLYDINEFYSRYNLGKYQDLYYSNSPILPVLNGNDDSILCKDTVRDPIEFYGQYVRKEGMTFDNLKKALSE